MPRPPILPTVDWPRVFESGRTFAGWIAAAEVSENRDRIEQALQRFVIRPVVRRYLADRPRGASVVAFAEDWCGDVVRHVPVLEALAQASPHIEVRYVRRDQHPEVFARFLTNGGEAIPKFVFLSDAWVECGNWGPMPANCRELIARGKACGNVAAARARVSALYAQDEDCEEVVKELLTLIDIATCTEP